MGPGYKVKVWKQFGNAECQYIVETDVKSTGNQYGDIIQTYFSAINITSRFSLPGPVLSSECLDSNPALFLSATSSSCIRSIPDPASACTSGSILDAARYYNGFLVVSDPTPDADSTSSTTTPKTLSIVPNPSSPPLCLTQADLAAGNAPSACPGSGSLSWTVPVPTWDATTGVCGGAVLEVLYTFTYEVFPPLPGTILTDVSVDFVYGDVSFDRGGNAFTQKFSSVFIQASTPGPPIPRSGNPGYVLSSPILAGTLTTNTTTPSTTPLYAISYIPNPAYGLTLPQDIILPSTTPRPECPPASSPPTNQVPLTFGEDTLTGCTVWYALSDINGNCDAIRTRVYDVQMKGVKGITHIGKFGNASWDSIEDWVQVVWGGGGMGVGSVLGQPSPPNTCTNILTHISITILTTPVGSLTSPNPTIIAVLITPHLGSFSYPCANPSLCTGTTAGSTPHPFRISASVEFVEYKVGAEMKVPVPPRLIPPVPDDVFYPFQIGKGVRIGGRGRGWVALVGFVVGWVLFGM
ncbi:Tectonic-1 [Rhizophlyctis rosea]|nr:Tectonic-1 [Rhizophlyctis rosea]